MRKEKQLLLDEIKSQLPPGAPFLIMQYTALPANKANSFRAEMARMGCGVEVVRKRVLIKAAIESGVQLDVSELPGHIALIFAGKDPLETTKQVLKFSQENNKAITLVGGRFDGELYNAAQMEALSKLPGKDEMRAQLLATLEAPMAQTLAVMDALLSSVVYCLDNKAKETN